MIQPVEKELADSVVLQYRDESEAEWGANILTQQDLDYANIMNELMDIGYLTREKKILDIVKDVEQYINDYAYPEGIEERWARRDALND